MYGSIKGTKIQDVKSREIPICGEPADSFYNLISKPFYPPVLPNREQGKQQNCSTHQSSLPGAKARPKSSVKDLVGDF